MADTQTDAERLAALKRTHARECGNGNCVYCWACYLFNGAQVCDKTCEHATLETFGEDSTGE